jgi:hypothetical protein
MDVWGWIAVYAVGLTLLQLLVYRYLLNNSGSLARRVGTPFGDGDGETSWSNGPSGGGQPESPPRSPETNAPGRRPDRSSGRPVDAWPPAEVAEQRRGRPGDTGDTAGRTCRHCGAANESEEAFSYCWNCAREL